jgi:heme/copper-type cytochrome/quinol oxidase subunit 4
MSYNIDKLFSINSLTDTNISLSRALLIFYIIIASQFTGGLMGKQMKKYLEESRIAQHLIGFILMLVLIMMAGGVNDVGRAILYSIIGYVWFIFTTKLDIQWNLIIISMLFVGFVYETNMINKEVEVSKDSILTLEEREKIKDTHSNFKSYMVAGILLVTLTGTFLYAQKKQEQYGGGFSAFNFFIQ